MADIIKKGVELLEQAEKRKKANGIFSFLFRSSSYLEEASDLYIQAANTFKRVKNWNVAGKAFVEAATLIYRTDAKHVAAKCYVDAGVCFKKTDPLEAVDCYLKAIEIYTDMGRFIMAAKHHVTVAEIYETECLEIPKAIAHYEQAAAYFKGEGSSSSANRCLTFVAKYAAQLENYQKAVDIYEEIGTSNLKSSLLKFSAKDSFFKAAICHMCIDNLNGQLAVKKYEELSPSFSDSRECKLLKELIAAVEEQNCDAFSKALSEYDSISRFDEWHTTLLLRIKRSISDTSELL